jgi:competence protein ComEA
VALLAGIGVLLADRLSSPDALVINDSASITDVRAYVTGAVNNPGVYPLKDGDRWIDALAAAGGATADANLTAVNLARRVKDEDQIVVPRAGQAVAGASSAPGGSLLDVNTASETELDALPGIGQVRATNIIRSRQDDGPFAAIDDLLTRKLVPQSVFDDITPLITVNQ